ncbi:unnamed protein product [Adineta ricciae]|uniref:Glycine zipper domain-containing protein n=1 Tax=Adineta ricciae TaxID=249248 RepID=A0A816BR70_ADIRI|nr:unnamed protein product [Adineta ricciae]CAF1611631.1 unnamed protein product [Adineta ricciae]
MLNAGSQQQSCQALGFYDGTLTFRYHMDFHAVNDWKAFGQEFRRTLRTTLNVSDSAIQILGAVSGSITVIVAATVSIITALANSGIDVTAMTIMITTVAGAGTGAAIGSAVGPIGTAVGGGIGAAVGWVTGYFATKK